MKTIPVVYEEAPTSVISENDKAKELYDDFLAASGEAAKLKKKLMREESKVDRLGFASKKIQKLVTKLDEARSRKIETLAEINELKIA